MRAWMKRWTTLLLTLAVTLAACGHSPPTHFYTLSPVRSSAPVASAGDWHVTVGNVTFPATLDRQSMVLRNGPNRLEVSDQARWAAPLDGMIRSTLADDLSQRLGKNVVLPPGDPVPSGPLTTVTLNLQHFIGSRDGSVVLDADWSAQDR